MGKNMNHAMRCLLVVTALAVLAGGDELKDLSSADVAPASTEVEKQQSKPDLGESEGFGGALMTSGSFTMMASQNFEEEEGELGEGEGFGGALMTSGSFTMMASSNFE